MGEIADFVTSVEECSEWPGTMLIDHTATVFTFRLAPRVIESLLHKASGLFDWLSPALPEDLCFFRFDGDPWLTTISHERVGALDLTDSELIALREGIPNLVLSPESDETGG
ncbi:MAG TPA: hypothetical protein VE621_15630 [Bryobacteraceae bacterium]|nr:hypothetical protein [Bryobacteraceae bacterium]